MSTINTVLDRSSIISVTKKQHDTGCGTVRTIGLVSLSIVQLSRETTSVLYFLEAFPRHQKGSFRSGYDIVADATHNFSNSFGSIILVDLFICGSAMD